MADLNFRIQNPTITTISGQRYFDFEVYLASEPGEYLDAVGFSMSFNNLAFGATPWDDAQFLPEPAFSDPNFKYLFDEDVQSGTGRMKFNYAPLADPVNRTFLPNVFTHFGKIRLKIIDCQATNGVSLFELQPFLFCTFTETANE